MIYTIYYYKPKKNNKCNLKILNPENLLKRDYKLIINSDIFSPFIKNFSKRIQKITKSGNTSIIRHEN